VQPELRILNGIDSLSIDSSYLLEYAYFNNVGAEEAIAPEWSSSNPAVASISPNGLITAHSFGPVEITAAYNDGMNPVMATTRLHTAENPVIIVDEPETRVGTITTTSSYLLEGTFTITEREEGGILISVNEDYRASTALPGLYIYLTNNPSTTANAYEIGAVDVFNGAHEYVLPDVNIGQHSHILYFCKPFNVKVGDGAILEE
ncbi:MAG: Ig-like domain-containing protein, partial [Bacteroidota bacterium]